MYLFSVSVVCVTLRRTAASYDDGHLISVSIVCVTLKRTAASDVESGVGLVE